VPRRRVTVFLPFENAPAEAVTLASGEIVDWGVHAVGADLAWRRGVRGVGVKVAVIDTGVAAHPDLPNARQLSGAPETLGHGTHVCGIIGAVDNGFGVIGVAPGCEITVYGCVPGDPLGVANAIESATNDGANVINCSCGTYEDVPQVHDAVRKAVAAGVVVVASAGNDPAQGVAYPAAYPEVIAVSAVDNGGNLAAFAPDLGCASPNHCYCPGVSVLSTWTEGRYARMSGTSQAAPMITGLVALLLSYFAPTRDVAVETVERELCRLADADAAFHYVPRAEGCFA